MRLLMHPDLGGLVSDTAIQEVVGRSSTPSVGSDMGDGDDHPRAPPSATSVGTSPLGSVSGSGSPANSVGSAPKRRAAPRAKAAGKPKFASVLAEKHDLLFRMNRMATRGGKQSRTMSVSDTLDELRAECERMQRELDTEKSVKFQRSLMTSFATGVEFVNAKWNIAGLRLDGWSEHLQQDIGSYDEVFEELHAKYSTKSVMPPELKLLMMIASSAFMFHMSKSMFNQMPGMEDAMREDPEFAKVVAAAVAKKAARDETNPDRRGMAGMFAGMMGAPVSGGAKLSPPDNDSLGGVERLFSDSEDSGSDAGSVASGANRQTSRASSSVDGDPTGLILDA